MTVRLPGLPRPEGGLRALKALDDDELAAQLVGWLCALREVDAGRLAELARLPLGEVVASPLGLRAVALGVEVGATSVHREARALLPWRFGVTDPDHGVWERGVLHVGKYQSFQAEAPHATFDPAHVAKWGPHELLHRAVGFFFRPDMSRFELYFGARLNELLPVALWYGHDQLARLDEDGFERRLTPRSPAPTEARWLYEDEAALRRRVRRTLPWLRAGWRHVDEELAVIAEERATGRRIASPRELPDARLDAASDATAYVVGHWSRVTDPSTQAVLSRVPHAARVEELQASVEAIHERLFFGDIQLDPERLEARRRERTTWDWLLRAALVDPQATTSLLADALEMQDTQGWRERIRQVLGDRAADVLADGGEGGAALGQLRDGVASVAPVAAARVGTGTLEALAGAPPSRRPLSERLIALLHTRGDRLADLVRFEALLAAPAADSAVPHLCDDDGGHVVRNDAFDCFEAPWDVVALHAGQTEEPSARPGVWLVGPLGDERIVLELDEDARELWRALGGRALPEDEVRARVGEDGLQELLALGVLGRVRLPR